MKRGWLPALFIAASLAGCGGDADVEVHASSPTPTSRSASSSPSPSPTPSPSPSTPPPPAIALGATQASSLGAITVYAVKNPVKPQDPSADRIATEGTQFAVADIKLCANADTTDYSPSDWQVKDADDRAYTFWNVQIGVHDPNLTDTMYNVAAGKCTRGFLTFEVPDGTNLTSIEYAPYSGDSLSWPIG